MPAIALAIDGSAGDATTDQRDDEVAKSGEQVDGIRIEINHFNRSEPCPRRWHRITTNWVTAMNVDGWRVSLIKLIGFHFAQAHFQNSAYELWDLVCNILRQHSHIVYVSLVWEVACF